MAKKSTNTGNGKRQKHQDQQARIEELERKLGEAEQLIEAIRQGRVDAFLIETDSGEARAYTLRSADRPYRIMIEKMQEGALTVSEEGTILYCNHCFSTMVGIPSESIVGKDIDAVLQLEDGPTFAELLRQLTHNDSTAGEHFLSALKRQPFPVKISATRVQDDDHAIHCLLVTDLRHQHHHDLLKQAVKDLESFAYAVSHDLKAPLRSIGGNLQLLEEDLAGEMPSDARQRIRNAADGVKSMNTLIHDLLSYSHIHEIRAQPVRLEILLNRACTNLRHDIDRYEPKINLSGDAVLLADPSLIILLLQNLLHNAMKFRSGDRCEITITHEDRGNMCEITVADNGIGIDERFHDRIFEIFKRINSRARYPGTGIGLALCKRIVTRHGGRIRVESKPGEGSRFIFTLPKPAE